MSGALDMLKSALAKRGIKATAISPQAEEMCKIIDHFNELHWYDRNQYHERIKKLEATVARLDKASHGE